MTTKSICEFCGKEYEYAETNLRVKVDGKKDSYDSSKKLYLRN